MNVTKIRVLWGLTLVLILACLYLIFIYVPTEASMGVVQRIFYIHVPLAWDAFLAFFIVFLTSILYLVKREEKWDRWAASAAHVGIIFTPLFLMAGSFWARASWGVWWAFDEPRLTFSLILWFIYIGYLLIRSYVSNKEQGKRFGAVVGILGFFDVPLIALTIVYWRTNHPSPLVFEQGGLAPSMQLTLMVSIAAFTALFFLLLWQKLNVKNIEAEVKKMKNTLAEHADEEPEEAELIKNVTKQS